MTGSLITPQVRLTGPDGLRGFVLRGFALEAPDRGSDRLVTMFPVLLLLLPKAPPPPPPPGVSWLLSLARRLWVPSPGEPARLKSKQVRSALSPKKRAICGFERNFFPHGLKESEGTREREGEESGVRFKFFLFNYIHVHP